MPNNPTDTQGISTVRVAGDDTDDTGASSPEQFVAWVESNMQRIGKHYGVGNAAGYRLLDVCLVPLGFWVSHDAWTGKPSNVQYDSPKHDAVARVAELRIYHRHADLAHRGDHTVRVTRIRCLVPLDWRDKVQVPLA